MKKPIEAIANELHDLFEIKSGVLPLTTIESISNNPALEKRYKEKYGDELYSHILLSITHRKFNEEEAKSHWQQIVMHQRELSKSIKRNPGVTVATLDYLSNIKNILDDPKIIEEDRSQFIADISTKDPLTNLYTRKIFDTVLRKEIQLAKRMNSPLSLMMLDIDDFKHLNDTHGHLQGDIVLRKIGNFINNSVREMDLAARYGGEELAIIAPRLPKEQLLPLAKRICKGVPEITFNKFKVTLSIGIADLNQYIDSYRELIKAADRALYRAKQRGKNQVVLSEDSF